MGLFTTVAELFRGWAVQIGIPALFVATAACVVGGSVLLMKILSEVRARRAVSALPVHLRKTFKGSATDLVFIPPYPTKIPLPSGFVVPPVVSRVESASDVRP